MIEFNGHKYSGKIEICKVCNHAFNNTRAGDKHRTTIGTYKLVVFNGKTMRVNEDQDVMPNGAKVMSTGNVEKRCLTPAEMTRAGMRQEANGSWNSGGSWVGWTSRTS